MLCISSTGVHSTESRSNIDIVICRPRRCKTREIHKYWGFDGSELKGPGIMSGDQVSCNSSITLMAASMIMLPSDVIGSMIEYLPLPDQVCLALSCHSLLICVLDHHRRDTLAALVPRLPQQPSPFRLPGLNPRPRQELILQLRPWMPSRYTPCPVCLEVYILYTAQGYDCCSNCNKDRKWEVGFYVVEKWYGLWAKCATVTYTGL
jgi:hypothetical protein